MDSFFEKKKLIKIATGGKLSVQSVEYVLIDIIS